MHGDVMLQAGSSSRRRMRKVCDACRGVVVVLQGFTPMNLYECLSKKDGYPTNTSKRESTLGLQIPSKKVVSEFVGG